jgi:hypothetical protein
MPFQWEKKRPFCALFHCIVTLILNTSPRTIHQRHDVIMIGPATNFTAHTETWLAALKGPERWQSGGLLSAVLWYLQWATERRALSYCKLVPLDIHYWHFRRIHKFATCLVVCYGHILHAPGKSQQSTFIWWCYSISFGIGDEYWLQWHDN